ncbi:MAG TPA: hydrolase [Firmicutes bacterium]|nr:hydrolase [Bacillota bacterium]
MCLTTYGVICLHGIVFDFNGTLYWDTEKHNVAWTMLSRELREYELTTEELKTKVQGRTTPDILRFLLGHDADGHILKELEEKKETLYRRLCLEDGEGLKLAPGAPQFLDRLKGQGVPMAIATSSGKRNLDFYFEVFELDKWFSFHSVVYDDGAIKGKPAPDIFLRAFRRLDLEPQNCMVVEDSPMGLEAAYRSQAGQIVLMGGDSAWSGDTLTLNQDIAVHMDFFELDREYFLKGRLT